MSSALSGATGTKLGDNARTKILVTEEINIDNGSGTTVDYLMLVTDRPITITNAWIFYTEATDTAGAASATVQIGTSVAGAQIVAATNLAVSKAIGARTALTLVARKIAAEGMLIVRHTGIAATEAGKYKVVVAYTIDK